jgi:hypothetical protein
MVNCLKPPDNKKQKPFRGQTVYSSSKLTVNNQFEVSMMYFLLLLIGSDMVMVTADSSNTATHLELALFPRLLGVNLVSQMCALQPVRICC